MSVAANERFVAEFINEPESISKARKTALEWGAESVSAQVGEQLALLAAAVQANNMVEFGTGVGISGLWLLQGAPKAVLTTIEREPDYYQIAKQNFARGGFSGAKLRAILGNAETVVAKLADETYDLVLVDADESGAAHLVTEGLRITRPGGVVVLAHALQHGAVADPANRSESVQAVRDMFREVRERDFVSSSLLNIDGGLFVIVKPVD